MGFIMIAKSNNLSCTECLQMPLEKQQNVELIVFIQDNYETQMTSALYKSPDTRYLTPGIVINSIHIHMVQDYNTVKIVFFFNYYTIITVKHYCNLAYILWGSSSGVW